MANYSTALTPTSKKITDNETINLVDILGSCRVFRMENVAESQKKHGSEAVERREFFVKPRKTPNGFLKT